MFMPFLTLGVMVLWPAVGPLPVRNAVAAAIPRLVAGAAGHVEQKTCFACHNQAFPLLALAAARDRGFAIPDSFFKTQTEHVAAFLADNSTRFRDGTGTGGQAATASFALLALELGRYRPDDATEAVTEYLLRFEPNRDHWRMTSNRPPSESSDFTVTYVSLRVLRTYIPEKQRRSFEKRAAAAKDWLRHAPTRETEDRVYRLLALKEVEADEKERAAAVRELVGSQRPDGGWAQLDGGTSDAYATGSALYALQSAGGLPPDSPVVRSATDFLLRTQLPDGTWKVKSRSKPFQPYYESGFPHGKDQFISISASSWATAALALSLRK
jgi:hypothetical protein